MYNVNSIQHVVVLLVLTYAKLCRNSTIRFVIIFIAIFWGKMLTANYETNSKHEHHVMESHHRYNSSLEGARDIPVPCFSIIPTR